MKKIITACVVCFTTLGSGVPRASAWWLFNGCCNCGPRICCRQPNAFSPFCCQGPGGSFPMTGCGYGGSPWGSMPGGGSPACGFSGDEGHVSQLPAPDTTGAPVLNGTVTAPGNNGSNPSSSVAAPGQNAQPVPPGAAPRPLPTWGARGMNPMAPGYYPGSTSYGPINVSPPNYSGFPGYGPASGNPSYYPSYPSYPSYGPTNGIPPGYGAATGIGR
jgi:hypothetical protein